SEGRMAAVSRIAQRNRRHAALYGLHGSVDHLRLLVLEALGLRVVPPKTECSMADPTPTTVRLQNIAQSYGQSAALMAAVEIGVFTAISNGAGTYEEGAPGVDIPPNNAAPPQGV